jgi:hypothetical protein
MPITNILVKRCAPRSPPNSRAEGGYDHNRTHLLAAQRRPGNESTHPPENEPVMTVVQRLKTANGDLPCRANHFLTIDRDSVDMQAQLRHLATVLTISGDIDARNTNRINSYATRLVPVGNALLLDQWGGLLRRPKHFRPGHHRWCL